MKHDLSALAGLLGEPVTWLRCIGKKPVRTEWQKLRQSDMTPEYLAELQGANLGVSLGVASGGLVTNDIDDDDSVEPFLDLNPALRETFRTKGRRGCNLWLRVEGPRPMTFKLKKADGSAWGEFRADRAQTIVSGTHPDTGLPYTIMEHQPVVRVRFDSIQWPPGLKFRIEYPQGAEEEMVCRDAETQGRRDTDSSASTASLHTNANFAVIALRAERSCRQRHPQAADLYESLVARRFIAAPNTRNEFIVQAVPFLYRAVAPALVEMLSQEFFARNRALFRGSAETHAVETRRHLAAVAATYIDSLAPEERELYTLLSDEMRKSTFRITRDLAAHDSPKAPPPGFFLACGQLGARLGTSGTQAQRLLREFCLLRIIKPTHAGKQRQQGQRGVAAMFEWTLGPLPAAEAHDSPGRAPSLSDWSTSRP